MGLLSFSNSKRLSVVIYLESAHRKLLAANQALTRSKKQLERANNLKDYIIMRASHELRTPLTAILGRTQLLSVRLKKSGEMPENWKAFQQDVEVVEARALHLRALIDSPFNLSRVHAKEISLGGTPLNSENSAILR
jgi:signal transduction histidine kinase